LGAVGRITLITGGARSGKSAHALKLASQPAHARRVYVATAEASDDEMADRIARHRAERGPGFLTVEEPVNLAAALEALQGRADVAIIDSLTIWVANLMRSRSVSDPFATEADTLAGVLTRAAFAGIIVTDEVGYGIVPDNPVARRFRDLLGLVNQTVARAADEVILMVAGYPLKVK
jgi:adenosylcobinamide kinase/adenosylcobinamide-phosphate guanylyltransferase